ncbi:MAG: disulfide bond formation protein B [Gammaproteobacteria bacterium]|nr:disulfide bond formation protein B [Gammaproteobacteria bacterium]
MKITPRLLFLAIALGCAALLGFGYYLQFVQHQEPCPMCIFQRLAYFAVALIALVATVHGPAVMGTRIYGGLALIPAVIGGGIAARQTWLQHLPPDQVPECGPGLDFMLEAYPLGEVIAKALKGTGECAEVGWRFLGLSIAEWSVICFAAITITLLRILWRPMSR